MILNSSCSAKTLCITILSSKNIWEKLRNFQSIGSIGAAWFSRPHYRYSSTSSLISVRTVMHGAQNYTGAFCTTTKGMKLIENNCFFRQFTTKHSKTKAIVTSSSKDATINKLQLDDKEWKTIYRFNYIKLARVIQKLKIFQTGFTCCFALPVSLGFYFHDIIAIEAVEFMVGSSLIACAMLYIMGRFCSRLIGIIYASNSDNSLVRIAHLNFWGNREDHIYKKVDFKPFSELPDNISDAYVHIRFYSEPDRRLNLSVRYGTVYNKFEFEDIFGTHSGLDIKLKPKPEK